MRLRRPLTFRFTLPDGRVVTCWTRDRQSIREDVARYGSVMLVRPDDSGVYERVDPLSVEAANLTPGARHVT